MAYRDYEALRIEVEDGVAQVVIDHPPINLFDLKLMREIARLGREIETDDGVCVIVFSSANPEFFIAHADVAGILDFPVQPPGDVSEPSGFQRMVERYRRMSKVSIGVIEGRARGGGSEFLLSLDMRFAARGKAIVSQPEVALGILPGGSGTQRLPRLLGRGRALEAILGCADFDAETAERYGWVNRALAPDVLHPFVRDLAHRIASFPPGAIAAAKRAADAAELPLAEGLVEENRCFAATLALPEARERMQAFLQAGGQTREGELELERLYERLREG
jgi:enoyl-CoA hydratase/carnithine racemase